MSIPPPPDPGSGPAGPVIFGYFPSLESNPPEAGPDNETHQSIEEEAKTPEKPAPATKSHQSTEEEAKVKVKATQEAKRRPP